MSHPENFIFFHHLPTGKCWGVVLTPAQGDVTFCVANIAHLCYITVAQMVLNPQKWKASAYYECCGHRDWMPRTLLMVNRPAPHHRLKIFAYIYIYVNYDTHCTLDHPWKEGSPTLRSSSSSILKSSFLPSWVRGVS